MTPNQDKPNPKIQQKVVWQEKGGAPGSACPACGATGSTVDRTATTAYFVCPDCQRTWHEELPIRSQAG